MWNGWDDGQADKQAPCCSTWWPGPGTSVRGTGASARVPGTTDRQHLPGAWNYRVPGTRYTVLMHLQPGNDGLTDWWWTYLVPCTGTWCFYQYLYCTYRYHRSKVWPHLAMTCGGYLVLWHIVGYHNCLQQLGVVRYGQFSHSVSDLWECFTLIIHRQTALLIQLQGRLLYIFEHLLWNPLYVYNNPLDAI